MAVPAIILAAGASKRLGQPKQLVRIAGESLLDRTIRIVREAGCDPVYVVLGAHREAIEERAEIDKARVVVNEKWASGIAASIRIGVTMVQEECCDAAAVMLLVCDQPRLTVDHLRTLIAEYRTQSEPAIIASLYAENVGIPAIFPASQFANLIKLQGDTGARYLLRNPECPIVSVRFDGGEFDIDTPEDLSAL